MTSSSKKEDKPGTWWSKTEDSLTWIGLGRKSNQAKPDSGRKTKTRVRIARRKYLRDDTRE